METNILATLRFGVKECDMGVAIISIVKCFKGQNHYLYKIWVSYNQILINFGIHIINGVLHEVQLCQRRGRA